MHLIRLKKRKSFTLLTHKGLKRVHPAFVLQAYPNQFPETRLGFTVSKKNGGAVQRNRIKRRLKEAARFIFPSFARPGYDYVLIGRRAAASLPFEQLKKEMADALQNDSLYTK
ncbi:MAG: ribonuclease P protein component [Lactobacillales bacterium]|jgi:ribonuclease P protein component|nr:ribonuclease P protein component [Lactobacillales bacterium]